MAITVGDVEATLRLKNELTPELKKVEADFAKLGVSVFRDTDVMVRSLDRVTLLARDLSFANAAKTADEWAAAVSRVGGASSLTRAEQEKVNAVISEAIRKYQQMGKEVPKTLSDLAVATTNVEPPLKNIGTNLGGLVGIAKKVALAFGVTFGVQQLISFAKSIVQSASDIQDLADRMGVTTEAAQKFGFAAQQTGSSVEDITRAISLMNDKLTEGGKGTIAALTAAGLSFTELRKMRPEDAFSAIAEAIRQVPDPMRQSQLAMELFGRSGQLILPAIKEDLIAVGNEAVIMSDKTVQSLDRLGDAMSSLWSSIKSVGATVLAKSFESIEFKFNQGAVMARQMREETENLDLALQAAARGTQGLQPLVPALGDAFDAMREFTASNREAEQQVKDNIAEFEAYQKRVSELADTFTGKKLAQEIDAAADAVRMAGGVDKIAAVEKERLADQIAAWRRQNAQIPPELQRVEAATERNIRVWDRWNVLLQEMNRQTFPDMTEQFKRSVRSFLDGQILVTQGLGGMGFSVKQLGGIWEEGQLNIEAYTAGLSSQLGMGIERVGGFRDAMTNAFTDIKGIVTSTLQGMVDDFFDKFGILGDILSGFVNNAIKWFTDWAFAALGWGKDVTSAANTVIEAVSGAAGATEGASLRAVSALGGWLSLLGSIAAIGFGVTALFERFLPTTPVTLPRTEDPLRDDVTKRGPDLGEPFFPRNRFATGTGGRFLDFGAGTPVMLHGRERVMTAAEGASESQALAALRAELASLRRAIMLDLPLMNAKALVNALNTSRVRA